MDGQDAARNASTVSEFVSLGARQLSGDEIRAELVGQTLDEGGWTWDINEDGTAPARADDLSWIVPSTWNISDNQYCRDNSGETETRCSNVYELDGVYRFSESDDPEVLSGWSVTIQMGTGNGGRDTAPTTSDGLAANSGTPVYAVSGIAGLLESLLPDGTREFPVVSNAIERNFEDNTVSPYSGGSQVTSISSDGNGGFRLTARVDGEDIVIDFPADSFDEDTGKFMVEWEGDQFRLGGRQGSFDQADKTRGSPYNAYYNVLTLDTDSEDGSEVKILFSFGARTPADGMPKGTATYYGWLTVDTWNADDTDHELFRQYEGDLTLAADLSGGSISGSVNQMRYKMSDRESDMSEDNRLNITNGKIAGGRFVADWQGQGPDGGVADTVRGLEGQLLGEFYGPGAEEVAGVVNGQRAATGSDSGQTVHGQFSGSRDDGVIDVSGPTFSAHGAQVARHRDWRDLKQRITIDPAETDSARVTSIEQVSGGGYQVTYVIDGIEQVIEFETPDPANRRTAPDETANGRDFRLGLFRGDTFTRDHVAIVWTNVGCEECEYGMSTWSAVGDETAPERLQTLGSASYTGGMWAEMYPANGALSRNWRQIAGALALEANFTEGNISGMIDDLEMQPSERESGSDDPHRPWADLPDSNSIEISDGRITDSRFTASWAGLDTDEAADPDMSMRGFSGDMAGAFYGPDGEEVAGVVGGDGNGWQVMGGFAGVRDTSGTEN